MREVNSESGDKAGEYGAVQWLIEETEWDVTALLRPIQCFEVIQSPSTTSAKTALVLG